MTRRFSEQTLVIASHNPGKVREIGDLLAPFRVKVSSASEWDLIEPEETEDTFVGNACIKARAVARETKLPALSDDSGLMVDALNGAPGVLSARWAGPDKDFSVAMKRVEKALPDDADRRAHFACALALCWPDGHCEVFEGTVHGQLVWPPRGSLGFGYDPMFVPDGYDVTFGEMDPKKKHQISHRADAFHKLMAACFIA